ncbi:amino acid/polyamine/organocation transporter, APC superfamily [Pseudomonas sp. NFPP10]|uniref:APC family permease n=1 Tax=unclassified Pseudomonas TaxID=196821 RepID=UPI000889B2DD|nr:MULTISPECIES: APC family permease [unclassified Pseudomonas]SDA30091.1 amino acid/polyamine/organocation transporter, APC superfamily [Pseudomonas sp. NFPP12]SEM06896.1 amino acid/polyamine/organocation transporter, APC superfamily [Pseudomonas sp. NFPP10]SFJ96850.1 amino acid/polyamine/organocation transporter, APC superfamily [Pseudomonas sp. NFPP08]SFN18356.1 amino acid/polyamine/organocation transporter, APC superfamily [Pseudomonas sp. NFPP05]SFX83930.1 amino acid/polyamine/organocatio
MPSANALSSSPPASAHHASLDGGFTHSAQGTSLRRILGLPALVFFGLVYMVPLTVFTTYGVVTQLTGGRTAAAYVITLLAMIFTALSYSVMVKKYPIAGSAYSYASLSFGPGIGFLAGWSLLLDYLFLPMINYLVIGLFLNLAFPAVPAWVFVVATISLVTLLNIRGIGSVSSMSNLIVCAQMVFVVVFVALVVRQLAGAENLDLSAPWVGDGSQDGLLPLMAGAAVLCLSFLGFDAVSTLAEETRDPRRDIPRAIVITTLGAGLLFILLAMTSQLAFPGSSFKDADSAASEVMLHAGGRFLEMFFTATYVAGAAGSALASQASVSRILFSMGRDGILPRRVFGTLSERYKTPVVAIVLVSLVSLLAVVIDLTTLASMISFGALVAFSVVNLAVIKSHLGQGQLRSTARLLQYGLLPLIGFALIAWLWTSLSALTLGIGLAWFALGLLYLGIHTRGFRQPAPTVQFSEQA